MSSYIKIIDLGLKNLVYNTFYNIMGLTTAIEDITFYPKDIAMRHIAENKGKTIADFINIWRTHMQFSWDRQRSPTARRGISAGYRILNVSGIPVQRAGIQTVKSVPVDLEYEVTFWSQSLETLMQVAERYFFWQHIDPNLNLNLDLGTSDGLCPLEFDMHFGPVVDTSQVIQQYEKGRYYAYTMPIKIDGWVFVNLDIRTILHIYLKIYDFTLTDGTAFEKTIELGEWEYHAV